MIKLTLKDGSIMEVEDGISCLDACRKISEGLARKMACAKLNDEVVDMRMPITKDAKFEVVTLDDHDGMKTFWHTSSHVMAQAVKKLFPDVKLAIGPSIDNGFYYDFDIDRPFTDEDCAKIEEEFKNIVKEKLILERFELPREEAIKLMEEKEEPYKVELIKDLEEGSTISFYKQGDFTDLCAGPHLADISDIKAFKILSNSCAYWRGDEKNKMLQRIYAISYPKASMLEDYLKMIEEAKKRDHRKLGKELDLFFFDETAPGMPYWQPKGFTMYNNLIEFWRNLHRKKGYHEFAAPLVNDSVLWKTSGHWDHYKEDMFVMSDADGNEQALKPMSCPNSIKIYDSKLRSYKDLPLRFNDVDVIHRNEKSGQLNGLFRVRMFRQDDSHNFVTEEQIAWEIKNILEIAKYMYGVFGLEYQLTLSTRPDDFMGDINLWNKAESELKEVLDELCGAGCYTINEGDGAFYGPKIDIKMKDCLGREWQMGTIQVDFQLPRRFNLSYIAEDGSKKVPVMLHRAIFGSLERFIGIITEHYAGAFPLWLAPVQVKVIPVSDKFLDYAKEVQEKLEDARIRTELDERAEKVGYKIREAVMEKVPYVVVVGEKDQNDKTVTVRKRREESQEAMSLDKFIERLNKEVEEKDPDVPKLGE
ncbi:MAG: threonine--tRNA ligase [Clostridia bacterium]|nr:threonine--tRNA ligase [Clostridia bacterium]